LPGFPGEADYFLILWSIRTGTEDENRQRQQHSHADRRRDHEQRCRSEEWPLRRDPTPSVIGLRHSLYVVAARR
jgi:hypothetical protein